MGVQTLKRKTQAVQNLSTCIEQSTRAKEPLFTAPPLSPRQQQQPAPFHQ
jgi:hypothetical protein